MTGLRYIMARRRLRELFAAAGTGMAATLCAAAVTVLASRSPAGGGPAELELDLLRMLLFATGIAVGWPCLHVILRHARPNSRICNLSLLAAAACIGLMRSQPDSGWFFAWLFMLGMFGVGIDRTVAERYERLVPRRLLSAVRATDLAGLAMLVGAILLVVGVWGDADWARRWGAIRPWTLAAAAAVFGLLWTVTTAVRYARAPISAFRWFLYNVIWFMTRWYHGMTPRGRVHLPKRGGAVMAATHVSTIDPILLQASCRRLLRWVIAREYFEMKAFGWLYELAGCIPVNRSKPEVGATRTALRLLESGEIVGIFPYGGIRPGPDAPMPFKPGAASLALRARVPLIPVRIIHLNHRGMVADYLRPHRGVVVQWGRPIGLDDLYDAPDREAAVAEASARLARALNAPADAGAQG
ncbi:MAG: hypothetical protein BIFFINMI_03876 [Phycisphaerae bacterium]|nr:hypothetical protein [Phycisphaerae bacterium]